MGTAFARKEELFSVSAPVGTAELLRRYRAVKRIYKACKIAFSGARGDVYNISRPFCSGGKTYIAGRVEPRDSEISRVLFFERESEAEYSAVRGAAIDNLQDPCVVEIPGGIAVGGTKIRTDGGGRIAGWNTAFYRGADLWRLEEFANAPRQMKDVRFVPYRGRVLVCTRPQGGVYGPGKIGWLALDCMDEITPENLYRAEIFEGLFRPDEWGGANELHILKNGLCGVLGHIAHMGGDGERHYYSTAFAFDPATGGRAELKIIAERADFPPGPAKRPDLRDVLFVGGLARLPDGRAELYTGTSDAEGQFAVIDDPFAEYEAAAVVSD
ncbi:MAG: DUF1861 family protein [Clostridiales bacterium]|nr:DUF1861 family protein [Clostridiales bacterium]